MTMKKYSYGESFEYSIIRSKRKSIGIVVKAGGEVIVKAPAFLSVGDIQKCVESKADWIQKKIPEMEALAERIPEKSYEDGEKLFYLGREYRLMRKPSLSARKGMVAMAGEQVILYGVFHNSDEVKAILERWYQQKAEDWITRRVCYYEERIGVSVNRICYRSPKTRWGSCSSDRNVMINWKLIMAPEPIIDYVVCHELCHILEMNHSERFWALVAKEIPDWKARRNWLKENGMTLVV